MRFLSDLKERRIIQIVASVAAAGWVALEVVNTFVERGILPEAAYPVLLVWYVGAVLASAVVGWYHGEKGAQSVTRAEVVLLVLLTFALIGLSGVTASRFAEGPEASLAIAGEAGLDLRRVAVLYFGDVSRGTDRRHVADGLTEALIDELGRVRELDVVSRNGAARVRDSDLSTDSIARLLGAGTVVDGSVEEVGDVLRANVRLLDGVSGAEIRRASLERPVSEVLDLQAELAEEVARLLREWLGEEVVLRDRRAGTGSPAAWVLVQRAERARKEAEPLLTRHDAAAAWAAYGRADSLLAEAESMDPAWAQPAALRARIAYERARLLTGNPREAREAIGVGLAHAARALERDAGFPEAVELRGTLRYLEWLLQLVVDPVERDRLLHAAREDLERAVELDPTRASAWSTLSHLHYQVKDLPAVVLSARRALEEDAFLSAAPDVTWRLFLGSYDLEQFAQARRWCHEGARRFPDHYRFVECRLWLMTVPEGDPAPAEAWRLLARMDSVTPPPLRPSQHPRGEAIVAGVLARAYLPDSAAAVLERGQAAHDVSSNQELVSLHAFVRTLLGDRDGAVDLLKRYVAANPDHGFRRGTGMHWWWRDLATHPDFRQIEAGGR